MYMYVDVTDHDQNYTYTFWWMCLSCTQNYDEESVVVLIDCFHLY